MERFIVSFILGTICVFIGISNMKGNIKWLHSYHRKRVIKEDIPAFGKLVGIGAIVIGITLVIVGILSIITMFVKNDLIALMENAILTVGLFTGIGISFYGIIKYNKGLF